MGAKTQRRHIGGDESRDRILVAATEVASQRGYHGTSIAAVSKLSGLPASSIYWHFTNKDDLIAAVIQRSFDTWLNSHMLVNLRRPDANQHDHLITSMRSHASGLVNNPEFLRLGLMLALERDPQEPSARSMFLQVREQAFALLVEAFERTLAEMHAETHTETHVETHTAANTDQARKIATLTMAAADGLFIAHQIDPAGADLEAHFEMLADVIHSLLLNTGTRQR
jgi:AcrR family transcriptional regulator